MVRADLLDCFEKFLRLNGPHPRKRFGGIQIVLIGDLYQLPPVVTSAERQLFTDHYESPWFFSAHVFADAALALEFVELEKIYRQTDSDFIGLLNAIRNRSATDEDLDAPERPGGPGVRPARGRFHDHPDEHERPGRGPEPGEARRAARPRPRLRGDRRGRLRPFGLPDRRAARAQGRGPGHAPDERSERPLGERDDRQGDADRRSGKAKTTRSASSSATAERSSSSPTSGSSSASSTTRSRRPSPANRSAPSPSIRSSWPGRSRSTRARARPSTGSSSTSAGGRSPTDRSMSPSADARRSRGSSCGSPSPGPTSGWTGAWSSS